MYLDNFYIDSDSKNLIQNNNARCLLCHALMKYAEILNLRCNFANNSKFFVTFHAHDMDNTEAFNDLNNNGWYRIPYLRDEYMFFYSYKRGSSFRIERRYAKKYMYINIYKVHSTFADDVPVPSIFDDIKVK